MNENAFRSNPAAPIVIGGVGGSGTRLVARILRQAGIFLGSDLNQEGDNLWFTFLFRRPRWFRKVESRHEDRIFTGLGLLTKAMLGMGRLTSQEVSFLGLAAVDMDFQTNPANKATRGFWPFRRAANILRSATTPLKGVYRGWGWKEPNSHIYLSYLSRHFPGLKYIHVIRHGLDLAFSRNQVQLQNWSFLFGLEPPGSPVEVPAASLRYWVRANERAFRLGETIGPSRFLSVNFDQLCQSPEPEIKRMLTFIGHELPAPDLAALHALPEKQTSSGRYLQNDCTSFDPEDVEAVRQFGFEVKL